MNIVCLGNYWGSGSWSPKISKFFLIQYSGKTSVISMGLSDDNTVIVSYVMISFSFFIRLFVIFFKQWSLNKQYYLVLGRLYVETITMENG